MYVIYKITNKINGKSYIGKSKEELFERRMYRHRTMEYDGILTKAIKKYGVNNFISEIIEDCIPDNLSNDREKYWIKFHNTFNNGYNATRGGDGGNTYEKLPETRMDEIRKKISESKIGDKNPIRQNPELVKGKNNPMYGKLPHNAEKISVQDVLTNKVHTFESNRELADFMGYKNSNPISQWKKKPYGVKRGFRLLEGVTTIESIAYYREDN